MNRKPILALITLAVGCSSPMDLGGKINPAAGSTGDAGCTQNSDCGTGAYCAGQSCAPQGVGGTLCASNDACTSGICGVAGSGHCCAVTCVQDTSHACSPNDCDDTGICSFPCSANCAKDADCKDSRICVQGTCVYPAGSGGGDGGLDGQCLIGGHFLTAGATNPTNSCEACEPALDDVAWSLTYSLDAIMEAPDAGQLGYPLLWSPTVGGKPDSIVIMPDVPSSLAFLSLDGLQVKSTLPLSFRPLVLTPIDLNGDNFSDLVVAGYSDTAGDSTLTLFNGDGDGGLVEGTSYPAPTTADQASIMDLQTGDFDGNGQKEVLLFVMMDTSPGPPYSYFNVYPLDGDGGLGSPTKVTFPADPGGTFYQRVVLGDFNEDGKTDVLALGINSQGLGGPKSSSFHMFSNSGGQFVLTNPAASPLASSGWPSFAASDFNEDGHLDLAFQNIDSTISVELGDGQGNFGLPITSELPDGTGNTDSIFVGDFNGDGHLDLVAVGANRIRVLIGTGRGTFLDPADLLDRQARNFYTVVPLDPGGARSDLIAAYYTQLGTTNQATYGMGLFKNGCN